MISSRGTKTVRLQRRKSGLDFSIRGGKEHGIGVVISWIKEGGAAKSLSLGDEILAVNGQSLHGLSHTQVVNTLKTAGASVVLLIRPNITLQDIFSNSSDPPGPQRGLSPMSPVSPMSPMSPAPVISKSSLLPSTPLPNGWSKKLDQKTGRVYFENHHTCSSTWTDPRSRQPVSIERFQWDSLPPGWERFVDTQGDTYYVNHHTQTTHWDSPRGTRQLQLLQQLREFLTTEKEKATVAEEELASKRRLLLSKNNELDNQLASGSHDLERAGQEESHDLEEGQGDPKTNLIDDIMFLNEEVDAQDEHVCGVRRHLQSLVAVLQSAKVEDLAGGDELQQRGAGLALSLSKELGNLHTLMKALVEVVDSISKLQRNKDPSATQLHYMLQLPTLVEKKVLLERHCWVHTVPDRLTAKTNCELEVELLLTREGVAYAQSLQHKLGVLYTHARSHQGWEELVQQLTSLDFQLLQTLYTEKYDFREKLEKLMMF